MRQQPGIYVHVPFCRRICPYCDFAVRRDSAGRRSAFVDRIVAELDNVAWPGEADFDTLYFGGGTPSLLSAADLGRVVAAVRDRFGVNKLAVHLEANPEDVSVDRLRDWLSLGVAFLSLGVQALDDERLAFLGRGHDAETAVQAIAVAKDAGLDTVSVDLIYGHRGQSLDGWREELKRAAALGADHLSCYSLTVEPGTPFGHRQTQGEPLLPSESRQAEFFLATHRALADLGLNAYEVSNFARAPEHRSRHNRKYWLGVPYLGLGPSAHSFDGERRWWNLRHEAAWATAVDEGRSTVEGRERLSHCQRRLEVLMLGMRTSDGVDLDALARDFDEDLEQTSGELIRDLIENELARREGSRLVPTLEGWLQADRIAASL